MKQIKAFKHTASSFEDLLLFLNQIFDNLQQGKVDLLVEIEPGMCDNPVVLLLEGIFLTAKQRGTQEAMRATSHAIEFGQWLLDFGHWASDGVDSPVTKGKSRSAVHQKGLLVFGIMMDFILGEELPPDAEAILDRMLEAAGADAQKRALRRHPTLR